MSHTERYRRIHDRFEYVLCYLEDFPAEDNITGPQAVSELHKGVQEVYSCSTGESILHWLALTMKDLECAFSCVEAADLGAAEKHLESAKAYFEYAATGKKLAADFLVDPKGIVEAQVADERRPM